MLNERKATSLYYDRSEDMLRVLVVSPPATVRTRTLPCDLLLDADGFLVGVDVDPRAPARVTVMLGPHEKVVRRITERVGVTGDSSGTICELRVRDAQKLVRGGEKSPYL